jgi:hypothetical protein
MEMKDKIMEKKIMKEAIKMVHRKVPFLTHEKIATGNCTSDSISKLEKYLRYCNSMTGNTLTVEEVRELAKLIVEASMELKATGESK